MFYFFITRMPVTPEYMSCFPKIVNYPNRVGRMFVLRELSFQQSSSQADPRTGHSNPFPANYNFALELCDNLKSLYYVVMKPCLFSKYFQSTYFVLDFVLGIRNLCISFTGKRRGSINLLHGKICYLWKPF